MSKLHATAEKSIIVFVGRIFLKHFLTRLVFDFHMLIGRLNLFCHKSFVPNIRQVSGLSNCVEPGNQAIFEHPSHMKIDFKLVN